MTDGDRLSDLDEPLAKGSQSDGEPDASAPGVERPHAERPTTEAPSTSAPPTRAEELRARAADVDSELKTLFWKLVFLYKLGIVGLALGVLLTVFTPHPTRGPALAAGGAVLLAYAMVLTRRGKARLDDGEFDPDADEPAEGPPQ